ncbi:MAG: hypothetical protein J6N52_07795 [Clostridia bacterium]|nr:hypothetical protein [Clostridia bacterium]
MKKWINRIITCLTAFALLLPSAAVSVSGSASDELDYAGLLSSIGIIDDSFDKDAQVLKGDYITYVLNMVKYLPMHSEKQLFFDVPVNSLYADCVSTAYQAGIITGSEDGNMEVDRALSVDNAIVITVRALGFKSLANKYGGYVDGYKAMAARLRLLDGISADGGEILKGEAAARLLYNALTAECLSTSDGINYSFSDDSILETKFNIYEGQGIVESCLYGNIFGDKHTDRGQIIIGGVQYDIDEDEIGQKYLGCCVRFYYEETGAGDSRIVYMYPHGNNIRTIDAFDAESYADGQISYSGSSGKTLRVQLSPNAVTLKNGGMITVPGSGITLPAYGKITVIDNNNDGRYDVVLIEAYEIAVVTGTSVQNKIIYTEKAPKVSVSDYIITDSSGQQLTAPTLNDLYNKKNKITDLYGRTVKLEDIVGNKVIDLDMFDDYTIYDSGHNKKDIDYITEDMLLNIYRQTDYNRITIEAYSDIKTVRAVSITEKTKGAFDVRTSDGSDYETVADFESVSDNNKLELNTDYTVAFNGDGRLAAILKKGASTRVVFGYTLRISLESEFGDSAILRVLNEEGSVEEYETAYKIKNLATGTYITPQQISSLWNEGVIRYSLNSEGKIKEIEFPGSDKSKLHLMYADTQTKGNSRNRYMASYGMIGTTVPINKDTKVFLVADGEHKNDRSLFGSTIGTKLADRSYYQGFKSYKTDDNGIYADVVVVNSSMGLSGKTSATMLVEEVSEVYDTQSQSSKLAVSGLVNGNSNKINTYDDDALKFTVGGDIEQVSAGDIIQYSTNNNGEIMDISMVYDYSRDTMYNSSGEAAPETAQWGESVAHFGGIMQSVHDNKYLCLEQDTDVKTYFPVGSSTVIYKYDARQKKNRSSVITADEIPTTEDNPANDAFVILISNDSNLVFVAAFVK